MKVVRFILSIILSFVLMLGIMITTVAIFGNRLVEKDYILAKFDEVDLYNQVLEEVKSSFENYIYQSGMEATILNDICNKEKVEKDIRTIINCIYDNKEVQIDNTEMKAKLDSAVDEVVNSQNRKISVEEQTNIENFKTAIMQSYEQSIEVYIGSVETLQKYIPKIVKVLDMLQSVSIITIIATLIILLVLNIKNFFTFLNCVSISLVSSGITLLLANNLINSQIEINNLLIFSTSMSSAIIAIINDFLNAVKSVGMWAILFGAVGILIISIKNMNRK